MNSFSASSYPRIVDSTSDFVGSLPFAGQRLDEQGDPQKKTPSGKSIISQRARLLRRQTDEQRTSRAPFAFKGHTTNPRSGPFGFETSSNASKFVPTAKVGKGNGKKRAADQRPATASVYRGK